MLEYHVDRDGAMKILRTDEGNITYWINDIYQVAVHELGDKAVHLNIRRRDGGPILRDWRHFQLIKNQLIGEECEAVELYPAESRLVDTTEQVPPLGIERPQLPLPVRLRRARRAVPGRQVRPRLTPTSTVRRSHEHTETRALHRPCHRFHPSHQGERDYSSQARDFVEQLTNVVLEETVATRKSGNNAPRPTP